VALGLGLGSEGGRGGGRGGRGCEVCCCQVTDTVNPCVAHPQMKTDAKIPPFYCGPLAHTTHHPPNCHLPVVAVKQLWEIDDKASLLVGIEINYAELLRVCDGRAGHRGGVRSGCRKPPRPVVAPETVGVCRARQAVG